MKTIYDKNPNIWDDKTPLESNSKSTVIGTSIDVSQSAISVEQNNMEIATYQERSVNALTLVNDIVLKNYLTKLSDMDVVPINISDNDDNLIVFKINKMIYSKDEYATEKFISVVSAMTFTNSSIYLIIDGHDSTTDFYLGIRCDDENRTASSVADAFKSAITGQFPGIQMEDLSQINPGATCSRQHILFEQIKESNTVSSYVGVPAYKNSKGEYTNENFIQGIEKFATAMYGKRYTAIVLATNTLPDEIKRIREGYEHIYTDLSAMASQQLAYSTNESLANAMSRTKGYSDSLGTSDTEGSSYSTTESVSRTIGTSWSKTVTDGTTKDNKWAQASKVLSTVGTALGVALSATGIGAPAGVALLGLSAASFATGLNAGQESHSEAIQEGKNESTTKGVSNTIGTNKSHTDSKTHTENFSETNGTTSTVGSSKNFTITVQNKHIQEILKRIDKQLERIEMSESTGLWSTGTYFLSYNTDRSTAEIGASIFRSIMQGEQSGIETSAINTWYSTEKDNFRSLANTISSLRHPLFKHNNPIMNDSISLLPTSMISSKELAMLIGLPRKSVPGLPVVEHSSFGKEVVKFDDRSTLDYTTIKLGNIFDQGIERKNNPVNINLKSMTQHTFVTGSTGCGKSNTIYHLVHQIQNVSSNTKFLIIEPAKGEYKNVFGNFHVYGTNPLKMRPLQINPFAFAKGVHVLEHVDRLVEVFNVCWPMYAAMPAVLKKSVLLAYENCGWDMHLSRNKHSDNLFPTFADVLKEIRNEVRNSAFSEEVKSNYEGSLVTRIESLTNGINKVVFCENELGDERLFDEDVIVDISSVGSQETKSLIMGILIMRLNEYRANSGIEANSNLRHVTILEEAHNILKRCSQEQSMEGSNVAGKSVEMISNAIAEMRTYGEGFIIVDQSPSAVDISAIKNTNTKIIMRLPEESDRRASGKSAALKDNQIDEIAKLPTGVAVVYQNNWEEPVLCQVSEFKGTKYQFRTNLNGIKVSSDEKYLIETIKFLLNGRIANKIDFDIDTIREGLTISSLSTQVKWKIYECLDEFSRCKDLRIWKDNHFSELAELVSDIMDVRQKIVKLVKEEKSFESLDNKLVEQIKNRFIDYPNELKLVTEQCLLMDYAWGDKIAMSIYNGWYQSIKNRIS